ncbi:IS200/IS605 family transposase [Saccharopolyspora shandongensis]|uniref:IS200/IS605 family transposase n=1 Tax=Saccharopolyspora shandongensis TaxID=418495 RepID=UPI003F4D314F
MNDHCRADLEELNDETNHVHLLVDFPPKIAVSKLVNNLKGVSSGLLRKEFEDLHFAYCNGIRLCSGSYFAGSVGARKSPSYASTTSGKPDPPPEWPPQVQT